MAQTYTLEEAAERLGMPQDEFKRRIRDEWKAVRSFRDGPTLRYRASDIDELARVLGEASDPGLQLGPVGAGVGESSADHFTFDEGSPTEDAPPPASQARVEDTPTAAQEPLNLGDDDDTEEPTFAFGDPPAPSEKIAKTGTDSNVKVGPSPGSGKRKPPINPPSGELEIDLSGPRSGVIRPGGSSPKLSAGASGSNLAGPKSAKFSGAPSGKIPGPTVGGVDPNDGSSEFELNLDADSDSFELNLGSDSDEADLGLDLSPPPSSANRGGLSGINLGKPADSGFLLEGGPGSKAPRGGSDEEPDLDFDLSSDDDVDIGGPKTSVRNARTKSNVDSDSEFELTLDDNSGVTDAISDDLQGPRTASGLSGSSEIFETDFELPVVDEDSAGFDSSGFVSGDDSLTSDFDLAISDSDAPVDDESGSEVVVVEDDDVAIVEDDGGVYVEDEDVIAEDVDYQADTGSVSKALRGVSADEDDDDDYAGRPTRAVVSAPPPWGPLPAIVLLPCLLLAFVGTLTSFEMLRGMWGYQQPTPPGNIIVTNLASNLGMKVSK